jgi:endonuclease/exonuclease/phosphatase (EEP) superfamily protein YafD
MRILRSGRFRRADEFFDWRRRQVLALLTEAVAGSEDPTLVAGDFNASFDSPMFDPIRPLFREGFNSAGLGYAYTRPAAWPWIGIDYVLATPEWTFTGCDVGPDIGSDHRPVIAELEVPGQPAY